MLQNLHEVFKRIQERRKEQKVIKQVYGDALLSDGGYQELLKDIDELVTKKKKMEAAIQANFKEEFEKLENIKLNLVGDNQVLSDISLASLVAGETVKIIDDNMIEYNPQFTVKFKKR